MNRSSQREAILGALRMSKLHPTADELYDQLRPEMPHLSLATVYRNLEQMEKAGMILRLDGGNSRRFDGNIQWHHHKRCRNCGGVSDVNGSAFAALDKMLNGAMAELDCQSCRVEFLGICEECSAGEKLQNKE